MDDIKELLSLAAKACGVCLHPEDKLRHSYGNWGCDTTCTVCGEDPVRATWEPHLDDGDGARMEAKLDIDVRWGTSFVAAHRSGERFSVEGFADHNNDRQAARRWASLRAAAQVGRSMP